MGRNVFLTAGFAACLAATTIVAQTEGEVGQSAPPEAFEPGNPLAYFGSENPWNRRMFSEHAASLFYTRRGQRQLLALMEGNPAQAIEWASQYLEKDPADLESLFMLALAWAARDDSDRALRAMRRALAGGLPFERFLAGPRELVVPLARTDEFQQLQRSLGVRLLHGPLLGRMGADQVQVWVRTVAASDVSVVATPLDAPGRPVRAVRFRTEAAGDFSGRGVLAGLEPGTTYRYALTIDNEPVLRGADLRFRTFPRPGTAGRFAIAFGGCAGYTPRHERMWDAIHAVRPDALLLLGDNVYIDLPGMPGPLHRYTYYQRQSRPEFRRLVASTSVHAIWDDHDAAIDDVWLGPHAGRPAWKIPNLNFFLSNWSNPPPVDARFPGAWHSFVMGDVEVFLLDGRSYRTNPYAFEKTMLGPAQKRWLFNALLGSRSTFKIIASPVNWITGSKEEGTRDTWQGFPEERRELFEFLHTNRIEGVLLLSSDRHRADYWINDRPNGYPLHEFGTGYLTNEHTHPVAAHAPFSYNAKNVFGLLRFDTTRPDPEATCTYVTRDGETVFTLTLRRSQLEER